MNISNSSGSTLNVFEGCRVTDGKQQKLNGYTLKKSNETRTFLCSECSHEKTSKNFAMENSKIQKIICNGCYGTKIAKS